MILKSVQEKVKRKMKKAQDGVVWVGSLDFPRVFGVFASHLRNNDQDSVIRQRQAEEIVSF